MPARLFGQRGDRGGRDAVAPHEVGHEGERLPVLRAREHRALALEHRAAVAVQVFERIAHQTLVLLALPHEAVQPRRARQLRELVPVLGRLLHEVPAVVEQARVDEPGERVHAPAPGHRFHRPAEEAALGGERLEPPGAREARHPDDVHCQHVEDVGARLQVDGVELVLLVARRRQGLLANAQPRMRALELVEQAAQHVRVAEELAVLEDQRGVPAARRRPAAAGERRGAQRSQKAASREHRPPTLDHRTGRRTPTGERSSRSPTTRTTRSASTCRKGKSPSASSPSAARTKPEREAPSPARTSRPAAGRRGDRSARAASERAARAAASAP